MPRHVNWGAMSVSPTETHSLANKVERLDRELDADLESATAIRAVREAKPADPATPRPRIERDETARWSSEIEVVRACVANGPPRATGRSTGGNLGRALDRQALGTSGIASSTRAYEPDLGSDHYRHAWRVWTTALILQERDLLTLMFASLAGPNDGGADRIAKTVRAHIQHGKASDAELALPHFAVMLPVEGASAAALVAIRLGWALDASPRLERWPDAQAVRTEVSKARSKFKQALRRVELDASGESLRAIGDRLPVGTKPLLIPRPSMREQAGPTRNVAACVGMGAIVDGVRQACEVEVVEVRVESASTCSACGRVRA